MKNQRHEPLISLITVSYNSSETILDTFNSIGNQSYGRIEYIVIDGASSDGTKKLIQNHSKIISKTISEPDKGLYDAMNKGISMSSGEIIGILNSDDIYADNDVINEVVNAFNLSNADIVYGNLNYVSKNLTKVIRKWKSKTYIKGMFSRGWQPPHPSFFVRKKVYNEIGSFDLKFDIAADFEFMYRALEVNDYHSFFLNKTLTKMRIGGKSNKSLMNRLKANYQIRQSFIKHGVYINPIIYTIRRWIPKLLEYIK